MARKAGRPQNMPRTGSRVERRGQGREARSQKVNVLREGACRRDVTGGMRVSARGGCGNKSSVLERQ